MSEGIPAAEADRLSRQRYYELSKTPGVKRTGSWLFDERDGRWRLDVAWASSDSVRGRELWAQYLAPQRGDWR